MLKRYLLASTLLIASASAAVAAATQDEADRIKSSLQAYLGSEPGVVEVAPQGDDYMVTLDVMPYVRKINEPGISAQIDKTVLKVTPSGSGQWSVSQSGPFNFSWTIQGAISTDAHIAQAEWQGMFDESLGGFTKSTYAISGFTLAQSVDDPRTKIKTTSATSLEGLTGTSTSTANPAGGIDVNGVVTVTGVTSAAKNQLPPDAAAAMPSLDYNASLASGEYTSVIKGLRSRQILDLVAWLVAHPSKDLVVKDQAQLKEKLAAALPLWDNLDSNGSFQNVAVNTAMGTFGVATGGSGVTMSGATKTGLFREAFGFKGLTIPPGIAPPWTDGLIPTNFNLDFSFSGFDLEAPAKLFLAQADFAKDPPVPPESNALFLPAFAPLNTFDLSLKDGEISAGIYAITYDGDLTIRLAGLPTGKANIRMRGLDDVLAKVQSAAATDPTAQQTMGGLVALKGFGKAEADGGLLWAIEMTPEGKALVNGIDVSAMTGMAPPPQQ
jgi:hypothetical protein